MWVLRKPDTFFHQLDLILSVSPRYPHVVFAFAVMVRLSQITNGYHVDDDDEIGLLCERHSGECLFVGRKDSGEA